MRTCMARREAASACSTEGTALLQMLRADLVSSSVSTSSHLRGPLICTTPGSEGCTCSRNQAACCMLELALVCAYRLQGCSSADYAVSCVCRPMAERSVP